MKSPQSIKLVLASLLAILMNVLPLGAMAQGVEMADKFRADGKIYIVLIVIITIFIGIIVYLFSLEKKIKKLERESK